jgi:hypothetical protein
MQSTNLGAHGPTASQNVFGRRWLGLLCRPTPHSTSEKTSAFQDDFEDHIVCATAQTKLSSTRDIGK